MLVMFKSMLSKQVSSFRCSIDRQQNNSYRQQAYPLWAASRL